jgi:hypothetical protein
MIDGYFSLTCYLIARLFNSIPRPSVNISCVCPTDQSWKVHMVSDSLTPSRYAGIAGYLADMTILKGMVSYSAKDA